MQKFYSKFAFDSSLYLKQYCIDFLTDNWNFRTEKIFRLDLKDPKLDVFHDEIKNKNLPAVVYMSIFCRGPHSKQLIHIDTCYNNNSYEKSNSNFYLPIFNDDGRLVWFDPARGTETIRYTHPVGNSTGKQTPILSVTYSADNLKPIKEFTGKESIIINTLIPHRAESGKLFRAALSVRLAGNPDLFSLLGV